MSTPAIEISNLSKCYRLHKSGKPQLMSEKIGRFLRNPAAAFKKNPERIDEFWALNDFSFEIQHGEVLGIVGRNGAGKSTLLKLVSRITEPTRGSIRINGRVASLLEVGTGFHPELTGRENIFLNGAILGMSRAEIQRKFDEIVSFAEVERFLETPVKHYSSGMYVRLAFAVAAHLEPEILIVDEVLAVGDAQFQRKCLGKMRSVAMESGRTVLFVSHNMGAVRSLCQKALWLDHGKLKDAGPTAEIIGRFLKHGGDEATLQVDLANRPNMNERRVYLTQLRMNRGRNPVHGESLLIELDFAARTGEPEISFGVGFCSLDGTRLMSIDSDLQGNRLTTKANTRGTATVEVPTLHLQPGTYIVDAGIRSGDYHGIDYCPGCMRVEVFPGPDTPPAIIRADGGVRQPGNWTQVVVDNP